MILIAVIRLLSAEAVGSWQWGNGKDSLAFSKPSADLLKRGKGAGCSIDQQEQVTRLSIVFLLQQLLLTGKFNLPMWHTCLLCRSG